jgi:tRNA(Ile)-lysidine synthase
MNLLTAFQQYIKQQNLFNSKDKLLLAVSGGVDSVVLCELCKQAGYDFVIAHCNFQLRGSESDRDEDFVRKLAETYAVDVFVKSFDTKKYAEENKLNIQVAARALRYDWFNELAAAKNIQHILTAHHANDNMETLLMNFFKGTGINGLKAVLPKHDHIIRPLLFAKKEELLAFTAGHKLAFVEDSSNASDKYTRNYFRNQLIPGLQKVFPQVEENLMNNIERFREIELLYNQATTLAKKKLLEPRGNEMHIPVLKLLKTEPLNTIIYEIIKDFGFTAHQTAETMTLLKSESGKYIQSSTHRIIKNRNWLIISPNQTIAADNIIIEEKDKQVEFQDGKLHLELLSTPNPKLQTPNHTAQLNADNIKFPMLLRKWKSGDYFYPLGMQKKKKLSRFFIDQKLSLTQKEKIWVIEMNKKIIWVVGLRIDDRFKITGETKTVLQVTWSVAE